MAFTDTRQAVHLYSVGVCCASACAPKDMPREDVEQAVNMQHPTGVAPWRISEDETFASGDPNPNQCEDSQLRQHWLLNC